MAFGMPLLISVVPSTGSTAKSQSGPSPLPTSSPLNNIGASSFSPSPITTTPRIDTELTSSRIASTAAPSPPSLSPRPTHRPAAIAPASVTLTSSSARLRSGASPRAGLMGQIVPLEGRPLGAGILALMEGQPQPRLNVAGQAVPHPKPAKSRLLQDGRDMFWSMAPLVLACVVLAGVLGMCSFQPAGPGKGPPPS